MADLARSSGSLDEGRSSTSGSQWRDKPLSAEESDKVMKILQACKERDMEALVDLATSSMGLVEDEIRRTAWPILLGCSTTSDSDPVDWRSRPVHRDEEQVKLDVNRSFVYYPRDETEKQLDRRKEELSDVITEVLRRHPSLCYFQGFHDIVQVFLLLLGSERAPPAVARLSLLRIRDFMLPSLSAAISHLQLLPPILYQADEKLARHLSHTQPFFALPATLTLYAHEIQEYGDIARLFDFLLAHESVVSIYLFAVIVLNRKEELLSIEHDEPEMLHSILTKLPKPLDLELLISQTVALYHQYPPETLPFRAWSRISQYSVLKTTRNGVHGQSSEEGQRWFDGQARQMKRNEAIQKYKSELWKRRRSIGRAGVAVFVVGLAWWLQRRSGAGGLIGLIEPLQRLFAFFKRG